jgi:putative aldouronate transport system substrate-binding protein
MRVNSKGFKGSILLIALIIVLSACSSGNKNSNTTPSPSTTSSPSAEATPVEIEPTTVKLYVIKGAVPMVSGIQDDAVAKEIERVTGVKMDIEVAPNDDKVKVMVATGDLPDLTLIIDPTLIDPLVKSGNLLDLSPYLDKAPNLQNNASQAIGYSRDVFSGGTGGLYALPARAKKIASPVADSQNGQYLRWDYYKELGYPQINNEDDLISVVGDMVKNHPVTKDGKKVYGWTTWTDWGMFGYTNNTMYAKYSGLTGFGEFANYYPNTNEFVSILDDRHLLWRGAQLLNKANRAGLLDPESFTQKGDTGVQKINEGRVMALSSEWISKAINTSLIAESGGNSSYQDVPMPDTAESPAWYDRSVPFGFSSRMFVVSAKTKVPEQVMKLLDYLYSEEGARTIFSGVKGTTWTEEGGKASITPETLATVATDVKFKEAQGIHKYETMVGLDYDALATSGQFLDLFLEPSAQTASLTEADKDYIQFYKAESKLDVIGMRENKTTVNQGIASLAPIPDPDQKRIEAKLNDYLTQILPKLILSKDEVSYKAEKEKIFAELKKLKVESVIKFYEDGFKIALDKVNSYK